MSMAFHRLDVGIILYFNITIKLEFMLYYIGFNWILYIGLFHEGKCNLRSHEVSMLLSYFALLMWCKILE